MTRRIMTITAAAVVAGAVLIAVGAKEKGTRPAPAPEWAQVSRKMPPDPPTPDDPKRPKPKVDGDAEGFQFTGG